MTESAGRYSSASVRSIDQRSFRGAYRVTGASVAVILTKVDGLGVRGITCTSAVSLSADPPMALVCVDVRTEFREHVREAGGFTINYLAEQYTDIAKAFAAQGRELSHLRRALVTGRTGLPTLAYGTVSTLECSLQSDYLSGDHWILTGHIVNARYQIDERPLVYADGAFTGTATPTYRSSR